MKQVLGRSFFLFLIFLMIITVYSRVLLDLSFEQSIKLFFESRYADVPLGIWCITISFLLGMSLSSWMMTVERSRELAIEQQLTALIEREEIKPNPMLSPRINRTMEHISNLLATQRKSLQRITNERAEAQDQLIQERIVQERQRLARELHDSVSQQLFAASMLLSAITEEKSTNDPQFPPLRQVEKMVQQAQLEMRALLLHLRPAALHNKSLAEGLKELLEELQAKVTFDIRYRLEEVNLSKGAEDHLFRIAQETLSNTLRHAHATEVDILFVERDGLAIFRVQDNGVGFQEVEQKGGSYGLQNVHERTIEIGGTCKIVSVPSQGTIVEVKLPIQKGEDLDDSDTTSG